MQAAEMELRLNADDLAGLLEEMVPETAPARVDEVQVTGHLVRIRVQSDGLGLQIPVRLALSVARVEPHLLVLNLEVENFEFLPAGIRQGALGAVARQVLPRGVTLEEGRLVLDLEELAWALPASFYLGDVVIEGGHVRIRLKEFRLAPMAAQAVLEGPGSPAGEPALAAGPDGHAGEAGLPAAAGSWAPTIARRPEREVPGEEKVTYARIRERIHAYLDRQLPGWLQPAVPWLLLLPDLFVLLVGLAGDDRVTSRAKLLAAAAVAYVALPLDLLPDFIPALGLLDDVALSLLALESLVAMSPPAAVRAHWPGDEDVLLVIHNGLAWVTRYYPSGLIRRLRRWLHHDTEQAVAANEPRR